MSTDDFTVSPPAASTRKSWPRRIRFTVLYSLYLTVIAFIGLKFSAYFLYDVPITRTANTDDVWRFYYGELWTTGAVESDAASGDDRFDVLLLGASVLEQMTKPLEAALKRQCGENVRIFNLSKSAHTTRDSALKFSRLKDRRFDLIVIYHGINDSRMNCVPQTDYRDDYTHCAWYASFHQRLEAGAISLTGISVGMNRGKIGLGPPDADDRRYGRLIKTEAAFRSNIESILRAAKTKRTPVVLMTFATYAAPNYSEKRFRANSLDYGAGRFKLPTEVWGEPDAVVATVKAHNGVIRSLAGTDDNMLFVDQAALLPRNGTVFSDICHLTKDGCRRFVTNLMPVIVKRFRREAGCSR